MKRRSLIASALAGTGLLTVPTRKARANTTGSDRKFLFVRVPHGWDTTRVFTPMFSTTGVSMEEDAFTRTVEEIDYVSHDERPAVDTFFDTYGRHTALLNGLIVPSVNHAIVTVYCIQIVQQVVLLIGPPKLPVHSRNDTPSLTF